MNEHKKHLNNLRIQNLKIDLGLEKVGYSIIQIKRKCKVNGRRNTKNDNPSLSHVVNNT